MPTREIGGLVELIDQVRAMRAELNIPWSATLEPHVIGGDAAMVDRLTSERGDPVAHGEARSRP